MKRNNVGCEAKLKKFHFALDIQKDRKNDGCRNFFKFSLTYVSNYCKMFYVNQTKLNKGELTMKKRSSLMVGITTLLTASLLTNALGTSLDNVMPEGTKKTQLPKIKSKISAKSVTNQTVQRQIKPSFQMKSAIESQKTNRIIVQYKENVNKKTAQNEVQKLGLKKIRSMQDPNADVYEIQPAANPTTIIELLKSMPAVNTAVQDQKYFPLARPSLANEEYGDFLWGLENVGQSINNIIGTNDIDINVQGAWQKTKGRQDVVVAVIDTGIDINHPDLKDRIWVNKNEIPDNGIDDDKNGYIDDVNGWDFYNNDNTVFDPIDGDEHGTHVAGTIAGSSDKRGIIGVAPNVKIMPLKFIGGFGGSLSDAIDAINYAKKMGVTISNNSWGGGFYDELLKNAIENSGMLFVAAAGNSSGNNDSYPMYPASYDCANIVSVGAVDNKGLPASFTNYGAKTVDIFAPGVDIFSSVPPQQDPGQQNYEQQVLYPGYEFYSGTSMASPHVAGVAALLQSTGDKDPLSLKYRILRSGNPLTSLSGKSVTDAILNAEAAVYSKRLNSDDIPGITFTGVVNDKALSSRGNRDDVYAIYLLKGEPLELTLTGPVGTDFDLLLYNSDALNVQSSFGIVASSENSNSKEKISYIAPSSGLYFIDVFASAGKGKYNLQRASVTINENSPMIQYTDEFDWNPSYDDAFSEGSAVMINTKGNAKISFTGKEIQWIGTKSNIMGLAEILLDGQEVAIVNLFSTETLNQAVLYETSVPYGKHTLEIKWTGKRDPNAKKTATNIQIDTVKIDPNQ